MPLPRPAPTDRRSFLRRAALGGAAITIGPVVLPVSGLLPVAGAQRGDDEALAAFAESLELAMVEVYDATTPLLSEALEPVAQTFAGHHREHAATLAELAGDAATGDPNPVLLEALTPFIADLSGQTAALGLLRELENQVATTYAWALTTLETASIVRGVATILPVESAHAATLAEALGEGPAAWFPSGALEPDDIALGIDPAANPIR